MNYFSHSKDVGSNQKHILKLFYRERTAWSAYSTHKCGFKPKNRSVLSCGHCSCFQCINKLRAVDVSKKQPSACFPVYENMFPTLRQANGRSYTFYGMGYGAKGKLRKARRHRVRRHGRNCALAEEQY